MNPTKVKTIALSPVDLPEGPLLRPGRSALVDGDHPHVIAQLDAGRLLALGDDADVDFESLPAVDEPDYDAERKSKLVEIAGNRGLTGLSSATKPTLVAALKTYDRLIAAGDEVPDTDVAALAELGQTTLIKEPQS